MTRLAAILLVAAWAFPSLAQEAGKPGGQPAAAAAADPVRAVSKWNLKKKERLAIGGYDPVGYFPAGGGRAMKGLDSIALDHRGAVYRFANEGNKAAFLADPAKYEPAYGGWCAWAMLDGAQVDVDPKSFIVKDGRLFLFYDGILGDTKSKWLGGSHADQAGKADANWRRTSGEAPRMPSGPTTLKDTLDARRAAFASGISAEVLAIHEQGIKDVAASGVLGRALKVGDTAPDFELPDARGGTTSLKSLLASGPVVVTWYRGGWCPYCNIQLRAYQAILPEMEAAGAKLVAISPQTPDASLTTAEKGGLAFAVLSDSGNRVARSYGVSYKLPDGVASLLEKGVGLSKLNGDSSMELPLAATYVIDRSGRIVYAFVDADYRNRAEPGAIVDALRSLPGTR